MKSTIVPAQITTVEDKIAGSLTLSQLLLLAASVFGGSILYIVFPPELRFSSYKIVLSVGLFLCFGIMAIRIKGKILLLWVILILRYNFRSRYYVLDKNDTYLRNMEDSAHEAEQEEPVVQQFDDTKLPSLSMADVVQLERFIANPDAKLTFRSAKKGGMSVTFTEVKR